MLTVVVGTLLWFPAVVGLGVLALNLLAGRESGSLRKVPVVFPLIAGLGVLGIMANVANFFVPITPLVAVVFLVAGWAALARGVSRRFLSLPSPQFLVAALCLLVYIAFVGREFVWWTQDSGLYHVPTIRWLTQSQLVLGLGNLHGRLAFNQLWFSTAAALEVPYLEGKSSFILSTILLYGWGLALLRAAPRVSARSVTPSTMFFLISGMVWLNLVNGARLNSPSPDLPGIPVALLTTYAVFRAQESTDDWSTFALLAGMLAILGVTVKLATIPLLLAPVLLCWWLRGRSPGAQTRQRVLKLLAQLGVIAVAIGVPWLMRGVLLSGTVIYPLAFTRLPGATWAIPVTNIENEALWIKAWARQPGASPEVVLANWDWLTGFWLPRYATDRVVLASGCMIFIGAVALVLAARRGSLSREEGWGLAVPLATPVVAGIFWFLAAPDMRFGEGYFWSIGIAILAIGLSSFWSTYLLAPAERLRPRWRRVILLACIAVIVVGASPWRARHWLGNPGEVLGRLPSMVVEIPEVPVPELDTGVTTEGLTVYRPKVLGLCWNGPLPCTPFFTADLQAVRRPDGTVGEFRLSP